VIDIKTRRLGDSQFGFNSRFKRLFERFIIAALHVCVLEEIRLSRGGGCNRLLILRRVLKSRTLVSLIGISVNKGVQQRSNVSHLSVYLATTSTCSESGYLT